MFAIPNTVGLVFFSVHNILTILLINHISVQSKFYSCFLRSNFHTHNEVWTTHRFSPSSGLCLYVYNNTTAVLW